MDIIGVDSSDRTFGMTKSSSFAPSIGPCLSILRTPVLKAGQYYVLCTDLDGYQSVSSMAETLLSVYISPVQALSTTTIWRLGLKRMCKIAGDFGV